MSKLKQWQETINDLKFSGLSQKNFCQNHNIKIHAVHYWIRKLNKTSEPIAKFVPFTKKLNLQILIKLNCTLAALGLLPRYSA